MTRPALALASATAIAVLGLCAISAPYTVDDAFIVLRYAQNIARGAGYGMNPGEWSDGVTGPLWLVPAVLAELLGLPVLGSLKVLGALCAAAGAWLAIAWQRGHLGGCCAAWLSAVLLVCLPDSSTWAVAGLETPLASLALIGLAIATLGRPHARPRLAGALLGSIAWLRPELVPAASVLWLALCFRRRPLQRRAIVVSAAIALAGICMLVALRLALFGDFLPLSARAKPADLENGFAYVMRSLFMLGSGIVFAVLGSFGRGRRERWLGAAMLAHLGSVALSGGDWMPGARLIAPLLPLYALLVGRAAIVAWRRSEAARLRRALRPVMLFAIAGVYAMPLLDLRLRLPEQSASAVSRETAGAQLAAYLREHAHRVALLDAGYLPHASGAYVIDLGGLTDARIARLPGGHIDKRIPESMLRERAPDTLVLHTEGEVELDDDGRLIALDGYPVEQRIARMPWVREHFRFARYVRYAPRYGYVILSRIPKR